MHNISTTRLGKTSIFLVWGFSIVLLLLSGVGYRVLASRLKFVVETPIELPVPLSVFPMQVVDWTGKDVPIRESVQKVAGNDDFINRLYTNSITNQWANVYVAYSGRPRTMLGHKPEVCYVGGGWIHDSTEQSKVISNIGRKIPCFIHRFHKPNPYYQEITVLNFYILNGQLIADDRGFSGIGIRTPNILGNPARYVAQVQISSVLENSTRTAAKDLAELILDFFPDKNGNVRTMKYTNTPSGGLK